MVGSAIARGRFLLAFVLPPLLTLAAIAPAGSADAPTRALVTVRTLVIDGMGTRTVDTNTARVPFGSRGLLVKKVPYAGPPLSFRLTVLAQPPQETGIPLTLTADVWSGDTTGLPSPDQISHREEATVVAAEASYLFEIDHDAKTDRRIVLSVSARPIREADMLPAPAGDDEGQVQFLIDINRESGGTSAPPEAHLLNSMIGRPVTYLSGIKVPAPPGGKPRFIGLSVTMTVEQAQGDLLSVKVELTGSDYVDEARTRLEPIDHTEVQTVATGTRFEVSVTVPAPDPTHPAPAAGIKPVVYRVGVIPTLG